VKLAGRIPVEPLDDERITHIERRVVAGAVDAAIAGRGLRPARRVVARALVVAAIGAAGFAGWMLRGAPDARPAVSEPAAIRVHTDSERSRLELGDATIESDPATAFTVTRPDGGVLVALSRGRLELEVGKRAGRPPLIVRAGDTDVVVIGTHFTVDYGDGTDGADGRGGVDVRVQEGVVRVVHRQQETLVAAGEQWRTGRGLIAAADRDAPPPSAADRASSRSAGDGTVASGGAVATGGTIASGARPVPVAPAPEVLRDRRATAPDATTLAPPPGVKASPPARSAGGEAMRARAPAGPGNPQGDLRAAIRAQRVEPALDLGGPDATRAITSYYEIAAHRSGDEASQAFYSIAVVNHLKLGRDSDALRSLDAYVRRFPGGKEYRAALWLRVRILCLGKIDDRCRAAAYTYLHEAPDGPAAHVAERLTLSD
jgi:FecR protein